MNYHCKISIMCFSMAILCCTAFTMGDSKDRPGRVPRNPRVVYDSRYDNKDSATDPDIMQFKDNFGPKVQERLTEIMPSTSQSSLREQYQAFKDNTYNNANDHGYAERNFDFNAADVDLEGPEFHANEEQSSSFEHNFAGNFETFDAGFHDTGDFFENADASGERKDPDHSAEGSSERGPEFEGNDDLSA